MTVDSTPTFTVRDDGTDVDTVVAGFAAFGLAGLTATDYLVDQLELEPHGHTTAEEFPAITPFEDGRPITTRGQADHGDSRFDERRLHLRGEQPPSGRLQLDATRDEAVVPEEVAVPVVDEER